MRPADTQRISKADAPVQSLSLMKPATFPTGGPRSESVCPNCNTETQTVGRHFAQSNCGYPLLTQDEASALLGAWLVGGFVNPPQSRNQTPRLIVRAKNKKRLEIFQDYLGICGRSPFEMSRSERYQLNTVPHPAIEELHTKTRSEVQFTRKMAQTIYILRGEDISEECVRFGMTIDPTAFIEALETVGITGVEVKPKTVDIQGRDAESFRSWASTKKIEKELASQL